MTARLVAALAALCITSVAWAQTRAADERFVAAREAARAGDLARLERLAAAGGDSPLDAYIDYWALNIRLTRREAVDEDMVRFLAREEGEWLGERARADWVRAAGRDGRWAVVLAEAPMLRQPDTELNCWLWQARLATGDDSALADATPLWEGTAEPGEACAPVVGRLAATRDEDAVWARARRLVEARRVEAAQATLGALPGAPLAPAQVAQALETPARFVRSAPPADARGRQLYVLALARLAQTDYDSAAARIEALGTALPAEARAWLSGQLGWHAARALRAEALAWFRAAGQAPLGEDARAWQVRAALRQQDWAEVRRAIEAMAATQRELPEWRYWLGRALQEQGRGAAAWEQWAKVAGEAHFYGMLADEELGRRFTPPPVAPPATRAELAAVEQTVGVQRALALLRLDGRLDGVREWNWAMRGTDDRYLLAAAELARRNQLYDRAIYSAERTRTAHDFALRYLAPYFDQVEPATRRWGLDLHWVYGLMRQESRFVPVARSSAGAQGLMQVMPGTATYVAKKIGLPYRAGQITDMDTNLMLGTAYLRMMLDRLDNHPALASAAYNAGPSRVPRWKTDQAVEGAVFAETIPLSETRDYVKKVLANTVAYAAVLTGTPQSLKARLGTVQPAGAAVADAGGYAPGPVATLNTASVRKDLP